MEIFFLAVAFLSLAFQSAGHANCGPLENRTLEMIVRKIQWLRSSEEVRNFIGVGEIRIKDNGFITEIHLTDGATLTISWDQYGTVSATGAGSRWRVAFKRPEGIGYRSEKKFNEFIKKYLAPGALGAKLRAEKRMVFSRPTFFEAVLNFRGTDEEIELPFLEGLTFAMRAGPDSPIASYLQ